MADLPDVFSPAAYSPTKEPGTTEEQEVDPDLDITQKIQSSLAPTVTLSPPASLTAPIETTDLGTDKPNLGVNMRRFQSRNHETPDLKGLDTPPTVLQPLAFLQAYTEKRRTLYFKMLAKGRMRGKKSHAGVAGKQRAAAIARQPWVCRLAEDQRDVGLRPASRVLGLGPALHTQGQLAMKQYTD